MKNFDNSFLNKNIKLIAGVDEAGRGPLAGPVVAAAAIFPPNINIDGVNDSKKLTEKSRESLYEIIIEKALSYAVGVVYQDEIDRINILQATLKAMEKAADKLSPQPDLILIDGNKSFQSIVPTKTIVKGDSKSFAIAAASILAKVTRDRMMKILSSEFPDYNWQKNKGYGTKEHIEAIKFYGATYLHRKSFLGNILTEKSEQMLY